MIRLRSFEAAILAAASVALFTGCPSADSGAGAGGEVAARPRDEFEMAIELIDRAEDFQLDEARTEAINRLNRWIENEEPDPGWLADPLIGRLPSRHRDTILFRDLDAMRFGMHDARFLQHAAWLRDIVSWVGESQFDPLSQLRYDETLAAADPKLSEDDAAQLELALLLFDWTVRNIQLDPFPGVEAASGSPNVAAAIFAPASVDPAAGNFPGRGIAGPGYTQFAGQSLLFGHGDALQRAAIFLLLCHQAGIDAAMLAIEPAPDAAASAASASELPPRPWLPATLIAGRLYLFDTALGLAIPDRAGKGLATLAEVKSDPNLLRALDYAEAPVQNAPAENEPAENAPSENATAESKPSDNEPSENATIESPPAEGERFEYPISADDLNRVAALIYAPVEYLMQRMRLLELRLSIAQRMNLTMTPSLLAERLRETKQIGAVTLWSLPYDTLMYRLAVEQQGQANPAAFAAKFAEERHFSRVSTLVVARRLHLRGEFDRQGEATPGPSLSAGSGAEAGAKGHYLTARMTDRELEAVLQTPEALEKFNLKRADGEDKASHQARLDNFTRLVREMRRYANYWMGLAHYENRNFDSSATWLKNQVLAEPNDTQWHAGANYNMGRARESQGKREEAIAAYRASQSAQRYGDLLRAKWLSQQ